MEQNINQRLCELERWRSEVEGRLGRSNGLRTGLEKQLEDYRNDIRDLRSWLDEQLDGIRRDQESMRREVMELIVVLRDRMSQIERPVWQTAGKVALLGALVLSLVSLVFHFAGT